LSISAANISSQTVGFSTTVNGRVWRWGSKMDVSGATPTFQIVDILTPFGVLRDTIPLPGEVVKAMADSIASLLANFRPAITVGPPSTLVFNVDEGRGFSLGQSVSLTNSGVYGSLLAGTLISSASWLHVNPTVVGSLASNQTGTFEVSVDSTDLLASSSPYHPTLTVTDTSATNSPQTYNITVNVRPKAVIAVSPSTLTFDAVNVYLDPAEGLLPGTYTETLRISGYSSNEHVDVLIQMVIT